MKKYRIKKEAVPFIIEKHATSIYDLETWNSLGIDIKALDEVKPAFISYGRKTSEDSSVLNGWNKEKGTTFEFTLNFPSSSMFEHDKFSKGRIIRKLMDEIQYKLDYFYEGFVNDSND